jgi:hypothetical protein
MTIQATCQCGKPMHQTDDGLLCERGHNGPVRAVNGPKGPQWLKVYEDALAIGSEAPGTVCVNRAHYEHGRHEEPYRMGFCHGTPLHWHSDENYYLKCKREMQ